MAAACDVDVTASRTNVRRGLAIATVLLVATQLILIARPYVNLEFAFQQAAKAIAWQDKADSMAYFWHYQANPLGYALLLAPLLKLTGWSDSFAISRVPSLMGGIAILIAGYMVFAQRHIGRTPSHRFLIWGLAIVAHPMIWLYTNQATADILPTGLMALAFAACLYGSRGMRWHLLAGILFSFACITKFNCALMGMGFVYLIFRERTASEGNWRAAVSELLCYTLLPTAVLAGYFAWIYQTYGIVFIADRFKEVHQLDAGVVSWAVNLTLYAAFLALFVGPMLTLLGLIFLHAFPMRKIAWMFAISLLLGIATLWSINSLSPGEMDFGGMAEALPSWSLSSIKLLGLTAVFFSAGLLCILAAQQQQNALQFVLWVAIPFLVISSASRPAQRYLILLLPLVLWWILVESPPISKKLFLWLGSSGIVLFACLTFVGAAYLNAQGQAADAMARWTHAQGISHQTIPDRWVQAHAGQYFPLEPTGQERYRIETVPAGTNMPDRSILHRERVMLFGYVLREHLLTVQLKTSPFDHKR